MQEDAAIWAQRENVHLKDGYGTQATAAVYLMYGAGFGSAYDCLKSDRVY